MKLSAFVLSVLMTGFAIPASADVVSGSTGRTLLYSGGPSDFTLARDRHRGHGHRHRGHDHYRSSRYRYGHGHHHHYYYSRPNYYRPYYYSAPRYYNPYGYGYGYRSPYRSRSFGFRLFF